MFIQIIDDSLTTLKRPKQVKLLWSFWFSGYLFISVANSAEFSGKLDTQIRLDERSGKDVRYQYRVRAYPSLVFGENSDWSVNGFAVTGDSFSSSHNTFNHSVSDNLYLRRLFLRYASKDGKTELGVLPTYKGRVSSTGLSKDGWIKGLRHVQNVAHGQFEIVFGELKNTQASSALHLAKDLNFFELEYSGNINSHFSFEVSAEHLLTDNFASGEVRYQAGIGVTYATELIHNVSSDGLKLVLSAATTVELFSQQLEVFGYYSYVSESFGARAELTEDFLATGHGLAIEVESSLNFVPLDWFAKFEVHDDNTWAQLGIKYALNF
ncbi:hypothetical protein [uncultured Paraglaciecola sp.]|uniref:hypothetical protein n=1 Tax=uncultured Paraglaciecola sp. TaxID=1765024 RepID=UPI002598F31D|nr:hypothetical protein [uncultured Paraglaciecola sp.]